MGEPICRHGSAGMANGPYHSAIRAVRDGHAGRFGGRFGPCCNALAHRPLRNAARGMIFYYIVWARPAVAPFRGMAAATIRKRQPGCASLPFSLCRLSPMLRHACRLRCRPLALPLQPSPLARPPAALSGRCRHPFVAMAGGLWRWSAGPRACARRRMSGLVSVI